MAKKTKPKATKLKPWFKQKGIGSRNPPDSADLVNAEALKLEQKRKAQQAAKRETNP